MQGPTHYSVEILFGPGTKWLSGVLVEPNGAVAFQVQLNDGCIIRRYDHLHPDFGMAVASDQSV